MDAIHLRPAEYLAKLPGKGGERFAAAFTQGALEVELYAPRGVDPQTPHRRDEVYVVITGSGEFIAGGKRVQFRPGDFLFVAAGVVHRFENFTDDLALWVLFFGEQPQGV